MIFTVSRTGTSDVAINLDYATADCSAHAGSHYPATIPTRRSSDLTNGTQTFTVPILYDSIVEGSESFTVNLTPQIPKQGTADADLPATGSTSVHDTDTI